MWEWGRLHHLEVGRFGEEFARVEFAMAGFKTYAPYADNHAVDFIAIHDDGRNYSVQVKTVRNRNYAFIRKCDFKGAPFTLALVVLDEGQPPALYVVHSTDWTPDATPLLVERDYDGLKSEPEYGVQPGAKHQHLLDLYICGQVLKAKPTG